MRYAMRNNRGFTLMELLVVMAISVILMYLVLAPVYKSFTLTRSAQAMVDSQDAARMALQGISRELGQAMYVYDNSSVQITANVTDMPGSAPADAETPIMLPVAQPGGTTTTWFPLSGGKIDFILPKLYMHCSNPDHPSSAPRDYSRNKTANGRTDLFGWPDCEACKSAGLTFDDVEARPKLPMEQDVTFVRYFLALDNNVLTTGATPNAGWVSPWGKNVVEGTENPVILYRAEFNPHDDTLFPAGMPVSERVSDPYFFYRAGSPSGGGTYAANWRAKARVVGIGKYEDLITATTNPTTGLITAVQPTITFRNASVENDNFTAAYTSDKMNDYPEGAATVYRGTYGYWTPDSRVDVFRGDYVNNSGGGVDYYTTYENGELVVMKRVPSGSDWSNSVEFNITLYQSMGFVPPDQDRTDPLEMAFTIDANRGTANFALQPPRQGLAPSGPVYSYTAASINQAFVAAYADDRGGAVRSAHLPTANPAEGEQYIQNARIVPGSERIVGPDMTFGPHYGMPVRYERVPLSLGDPGMNQYKIDYDLGWLFFSRDPSLDLPIQDHSGAESSVQVYYLIYFNQKDDVVRGDYLTKGLIDVHLGMRMFDPDLGEAHPVDLNSSVKVRNAIR